MNGDASESVTLFMSFRLANPTLMRIFAHKNQKLMNRTIFNKTFMALGIATSALTLGSCGDDDISNEPDIEPHEGIVAYYDVSGTILNTENKPVTNVEITIENVFETGEGKTPLYEANSSAYFINTINTEGEYHKVGFLSSNEPIWNMRHFRIIVTPGNDE